MPRLLFAVLVALSLVGAACTDPIDEAQQEPGPEEEAPSELARPDAEREEDADDAPFSELPDDQRTCDTTTEAPEGPVEVREAGSAQIMRAEEGLAVEGVEPAEGWEATPVAESGEEVEVSFTSEPREVVLTASLDDQGDITVEICEDRTAP